MISTPFFLILGTLFGTIPAAFLFVANDFQVSTASVIVYAGVLLGGWSVPLCIRQIGGFLQAIKERK